MKKITYLFGFIILIIASSCQDVIHVDLNTASPKLVVDGSLQWLKGTTGNEQKITLTTTTGYYDTTIPTVSGAIVTVTNSDNVVFNFTEQTPNSGVYVCSNFVPEIDKGYLLTILLNGQTYTATETLKSVAPITNIVQTNDVGFGGETEVQLKTYFNDPAIATNYYLFRYKTNINAIPSFNALKDEFFQGNSFFDFYTNKKLKPNDTVDITSYGISQRYFEYMNKLITVAGSQGGSPFSTPPATVRGNIVNQTNADNFALGYFNVSETDHRLYTVQ